MKYDCIWHEARARWVNEGVINEMVKKIKRKIKNLIYKILHKYDYLCVDVSLKSSWLGNLYGGFYIAPQLVSSSSIVYSFGIGEDISFDRSLSNMTGCTVHCFDPTPKSLIWLKKQSASQLSKIVVHPYGIAEKTHQGTFYLPKNKEHVSGSIVEQTAVDEDDFIEVPLKSISDIMLELGHNHIDVLKMDIEGAEYEVIQGLVKSNITIGQILIEFHDRLFPKDPLISARSVRLLRDAGYRIYAVSDTFEEVSFVHCSNVPLECNERL